MEVNQIFGYPKLRRANIPPDERDVFDRTGEAGVQLALMGSFHPKSELATILNNEPLAKHTVAYRAGRYTRASRVAHGVPRMGYSDLSNRGRVCGFFTRFSLV
jgi:hypothetical protein